MSIRLVNLTPHPLAVIGDDGSLLARRDPDGPPARIDEMRDAPQSLHTDLGSLPLVTLAYSDGVTDLPEPLKGVWLVVSRVTAAALAERRADLVFPLDEVRAADGTIIGCRALGRFAAPESPSGRG